jgi:arylsulfatase A-like enzyme
MKHNRLLIAALLLAPLAAIHAADASKPVQPNILVIFTDDLDFEDVGSLARFGDAARAGKSAPKRKPVITPNLDRLVGQSLVFTQFHVASVVCTPSRYALLTGQYGSRSASLRNKHPVTGPANVEFKFLTAFNPYSERSDEAKNQ